ncbi:PREDICTED: 52 kDa repressor of the inhibitor of the protein kinase-like [Amphimedon queenslandica]|nr:PREDICTED: 52 kDa repressor of the inhibitor of the protein kinase-like [Amphimedon queenslandica]|eukprot:XP_011409418.1 PREDICTED: 52 kDa repressor of the inhibitor of the protein kinase-like [Amphimedon queenslandica]
MPFPHSLSGELARWKLMWIEHTDTGDNILPSNFLQSLGACDSQSLPNVYHLLDIGCTLPITSSEAERTFSLLRCLKTYTRSTLNEEHFSDLAVIAMHYAQRIPVSDIIQAFIQQQPRRIYQRSVQD